MDKQRRVIALGFFDGVHLGHAALLRTVEERAAQLGAEPCAFTFDQSPAAALTGKEVPLLTDVADRTALMRELYGIRQVVVASFQKLRDMDWQDFIEGYLVREHGAVHLVAGHDFRFGCRGEGDPERLEEKCAALGIGCDIVPRVELDGVTVSSTHIRALIAGGELERANAFLGHPFALTAKVDHGKRLGSRLGFPTVNLRFPAGVIVPAFGVYATKVRVLPEYPDHSPCIPGQGPYLAVTNVGVRPTVDTDGGVTVESHLLEQTGELYGAECRVEFLKMLRPEKRFGGLEALREQIARDAAEARAYFDEKENKETCCAD